MPIQCRLISDAPTRENPARPGDMWFAPWLYTEEWKHPALSPEYLNNWANKRPPLFVKLPNGHDWCPDMRFGGGTDAYGLKANGWSITGEFPNFTASPSINSSQGDPKGYHGWLQDGKLTDDLEGRSYPEVTKCQYNAE